jgi:hypothetical protein
MGHVARILGDDIFIQISTWGNLGERDCLGDLSMCRWKMLIE